MRAASLRGASAADGRRVRDGSSPPSRGSRTPSTTQATMNPPSMVKTDRRRTRCRSSPMVIADVIAKVSGEVLSRPMFVSERSALRSSSATALRVRMARSRLSLNSTAPGTAARPSPSSRKAAVGVFVEPGEVARSADGRVLVCEQLRESRRGLQLRWSFLRSSPVKASSASEAGTSSLGMSQWSSGIRARESSARTVGSTADG